MKISFIVPAADLRRNWIYRLGSSFYGHSNSITGPLILGKILKDQGHRVSVYEELYADIDLMNLKNSDLICIYTMSSNAIRAYQIADFCRQKLAKRVIIGGIHASSLPQEALKHADQIIVGESENVILDVAEGKIKDKIVYAKPVQELDRIPFPDYSLLKTPCTAANLMTSRGCPFRCSFCTTSRMFRPYRKRSPQNVIEELKIYKKMGFKYVNFEDDNFTADKERAKEILRLMIKNKLVFKETFFFGRADIAEDEELLALLSKANLKRVLIGFESINQKTLNYIHKNQKVRSVQNYIQKLAKYKIKVIASIVLGLDPEGKEEVRNSIEFAKKINAYQLQPAILTPYPGTPLYNQYKSEGRILINDWQYWDMMHVVFQPKNFSPWELQKEFFRSVKNFYSFKSAFKIFKLFGFEAGMRRLGLWIAGVFGDIFFQQLSKKDNGNIYYLLKQLSLPKAKDVNNRQLRIKA